MSGSWIVDLSFFEMLVEAVSGALMADYFPERKIVSYVCISQSPCAVHFCNIVLFVQTIDQDHSRLCQISWSDQGCVDPFHGLGSKTPASRQVVH